MSFVTLKIKELFFDGKAVIAPVETANKRNLGYVGGYIRKVARSLMKKRGPGSKGVASPGQAPSAHANPEVKRLMFYAYDTSSDSEVVGPTPLAGHDGSIPGLLERGGTVVRRGVIRSRTLHYRPHAYMGPALQKTLDEGKIPSYWQDSVRGPQ